MDQVIIRYIDLPFTARGFVREDSNGDYNIYINEKLPSDIQEKVLKHELRHIERSDFERDALISEIEGFA